jgi:hypothetical protein
MLTGTDNQAYRDSCGASAKSRYLAQHGYYHVVTGPLNAIVINPKLSAH